MAKRRNLKWMCFSMLLGFSCTKEHNLVNTYLSVKLGDQNEVAEWMNLSSARQDDTGMISIDATGYYGEEFHLQLKNISDTGSVLQSNIDNISCYDGWDLKSSRLLKRSIFIDERTNQYIKGTFKIVLEDIDTVHDTIDASGTFSVSSK